MGAPQYEQAGADVAGTGATDTIPRWTGATTLGDSPLTVSGSNVTGAGAIRATGTTQTTPAFMRHDATTSGIYFPGTNEIGFTISGSHAMFISTGRNVGIGTTSPAKKLTVESNQPIRLGTSTKYWDFLQYTTDVFGWLSNAGQYSLFMDNSNGNIGIGTTAAAPVSRLDVAGTITCDDAGTGIKLAPATAASFSTDPNTLDCYQENTWTATDGSGASLTFTVNNPAVYTRIGRLVHARIDITFPATANASSALVTLPFTAVAYGGTTSCFVSGIGQVLALANSSGIEFYNAAGTRQTNANLSAARIICAIVYQAS